MNPESRSFNLRNIIIYGLIAIGLALVVIGGIVWAKSQANRHAAQQQQNTPADDHSNDNQDQQATTPPATTDPQPSTPQPGSVSSAQTSSAATTGPAQVPATGAGEWLLLVVSIAGTAFAFMLYTQSKRRLLFFR